MKAEELVKTLKEKFVLKRHKFVINERKDEEDGIDSIWTWGTITITDICGNGYLISYNYDETDTDMEINHILTIGSPSVLGLVEIIKTTKVGEDDE